MTSTFGYTYDPASLPLTSRLTAFGESATTTMTYAKTNELAKITSEGRDWHVAYAGSGGLSSIWSTLSIHTRSFDIYGRLEAVRLGFKYPSQAYHTDLAESVLSYDSRGRIASHRMLSSTLDASETFGYDTADRLKTWSRTGLGAGSATYDYDSSGNLTTATVSGVATTFTTDAENRLTRSAAGSAVTTFTNDLYGRRTSRVTPSATTTYTWDPSGHLSSVTSTGTTVTYAYGITGMRESKTIETASGATQTKSVWDGSALAAEQDSDGTVYRYLWGPDRTPLSVSVEYSTGATETFSYHTDALGSVVAMTDGSGSVVARYSYDPYGRCTAATGEGIATRNPLRYRAYYADAETGLFYLPARYYDPATYRFLSRDPAAPSAGDPLSLNAYAYCLGDPVGASDPSGAIMQAGGGGGWTPEDIAAGKPALVHGSKRKDMAWGNAYLAKLKQGAAYRRWANRQAANAYAAAMAGMRTAAGVAATEAAWWGDFHEEQRKADMQSSWSTTDPQDDPVGYGFSAAGAVVDGFTVITAPTGVGLVVCAGIGALLGVAELSHTWGRYRDGDATLGDLTLAGVGVVPIVGLYKPLKGVGAAATFVDHVSFTLDTASWFE